MVTLDAKKRDTQTRGDINKLRDNGFVPGVLYGGSEQNKRISLDKNSIKNLIISENFFSAILNLNIDGKEEKVLPRDISFDPLSDEPTHIDFLRIVKGAKLALEIPVKFINSEKSPGLKKGGVLNIVRRKVELKCPIETIPSELVVDLDNTEIGTSIKISSIKLPENVVPTIQGRDFVVATVAPPTVVVEPEKPAEETTVEGETTDAEASPEDTVKQAEGEKDKNKDQVGKEKEQSKKAPEVKKEEKTKK
tara:strand:- start:72 stop:821 length:750 start_codon:yes stop_codon:yes gene_type:complete